MAKSTTGSRIRGLFTIPGTPAAPILPTVEGLGRGARWIYSVKLVMGKLYEIDSQQAGLGQKVPTSGSPMPLLVIRLTSRLSEAKLSEVGRELDASFLLKGCCLCPAGLTPGLRTYQVYNLWWSLPSMTGYVSTLV
ncbi:uncharacterized protein BDZ99DRAFT_461216 [Mytilinidion resinicola]|uniref:Uncharacterized protein n=1 Tax=Mytilinidion resinicola TaxID=574789 RepID=A0A6A6YVH1_9PEZI|nr:uncharacterized protein BDZ99DRAFT_461216 [Mytilinidion resinicola]KAF2812548.1 hypothetical protein BDZ99DRAFT_461216 [Mytilinidion resinicola]